MRLGLWFSVVQPWLDAGLVLLRNFTLERVLNDQVMPRSLFYQYSRLSEYGEDCFVHLG
jgi:hypothetical protein